MANKKPHTPILDTLHTSQMSLHFHHLLLLLLLAVFSTTTSAANDSSSCAALPDADIVRAAFGRVVNFPLPLPGRRPCRPIRRLIFPSRNLTGFVSWQALANLSALLTVNFSGNSLHGGVSGDFWRAPSLHTVDLSDNRLAGALRFEPNERLRSLDVSGNRFTSVAGVAGLAGVEVLDVSGNMIRSVPEGLRGLTRVSRLNLSWNSMAGRFPDDLPPLAGVEFLDVSHNNFSGVVDAVFVKKFGWAAFANAGNASLVIEGNSPARGGKNDSRSRRCMVVVVCVVVSVAVLVFLAVCVGCGVRRGRKTGKDEREKKARGWEEEEVVVGAAKAAAGAQVVVFERPLLELTLADLAVATSGFGRESQLAECGGRSGAAYRAVLPGDLHVVVRVVEGAVAGVGEDDDAAGAAAGFRELALLRHPNVLPLLGYCVAGKERFLVYEYMEKGDLHRWLHELPAGSIDMEDTGIDAHDTTDNKKSTSDWPTRYQIMLGVARGLAFLHQGWAGSGRPIVHGHLVSTNILLSDDLVPRISDFIHHSNETAQSDVYNFGVLVFELMSGQVKWYEASVNWARAVIRNQKGLNIIDQRLTDETVEREMMECLQVGYLCTAHLPEKRPTMQQVVGVLKDIRSTPSTS